MTRWTLAVLLVLTLPVLSAPPARGDHDDDGPDHGKGHRAEHGDDRGEDYDRGHFSPHHREVTRLYFDEERSRGHCPPGLAKKHDGCMPPGLARKHYWVGKPVPSGVVLVPVPEALAVRLGPPPGGCRYAMIDGDLVKLAVGTSLVVDAIQGLSR